MIFFVGSGDWTQDLTLAWHRFYRLPLWDSKTYVVFCHQSFWVILRKCHWQCVLQIIEIEFSRLSIPGPSQIWCLGRALFQLQTADFLAVFSPGAGHHFLLPPPPPLSYTHTPHTYTHTHRYLWFWTGFHYVSQDDLEHSIGLTSTFQVLGYRHGPGYRTSPNGLVPYGLSWLDTWVWDLKIWLKVVFLPPAGNINKSLSLIASSLLWCGGKR